MMTSDEDINIVIPTVTLITEDSVTITVEDTTDCSSKDTITPIVVPTAGACDGEWSEAAAWTVPDPCGQPSPVFRTKNYVDAMPSPSLPSTATRATT